MFDTYLRWLAVLALWSLFLVWLLVNAAVCSEPHGPTGPDAGPSALANLVAHWTFDTDADDATGNHDGTFVNGAKITGDSVVGAGALDLRNANGIANGYVDIPTAVLNSAESYSASYWVAFNSLPKGNQSVIHDEKYADGSLHLGVNTNYAYQAIASGPYTASGAIPLNGTWTHVAYTYDSSTGVTTPYFNGRPLPTVACTAGRTVKLGPATIGAWAGTSRFPDGCIDELRIYTGLLSPEQVLAQFEVGNVPYEAGNVPSTNELESLRTAVESLEASFPSQYPGEAFLRRLADLRGRLDDGKLSPELRDELKMAQREMLVDENPLLKSRKLLFVKRNTYGSYHYYDDHDNGIIRAGMGGNLCVLSLEDGAVREIASQLTGGLFDRYDLSFDGRRIVFGYCRAIDDGLRLWEIGADGTGLRQVTFPPPGETAKTRAALSPSWWTPGGATARDGQGNLSSRRFMAQDFHPCYLPDGRIVFTSTRAKQTVLCGDIGLSVPNLFRIESDGSGLVRLSRGTLNELCPTVMNDGRILYNRWEYVFKSLFLVQPLWAMYPDGSRSEEVIGNNIGQPGVLIQGRAVPGRDDLIVCIGACHEQMAVGPVLLVDLKCDKRSASALRSVTPEVESRGIHDRWFLRNGKMVKDTGSGGPVFCDPYPLSDQFFLVSHNPGKPISDKTAYGIWLIDVFGNRVPVYKDPAISCWQPMLLGSRPKPPSLPQTTGPGLADISRSEAEGTLFVQDVHRGLVGAKPGCVKYLRVVEEVPRGWDVFQQASPDDGGNGSPRAVLNKGTHIWVAVLHGVVPVEADGSALFTVPADRNIFLQALDENFMEVQTMRTFVNLKPGERRSCVGCHEDRRQSPSGRPAPALALEHPPVKLQAQPGDAHPSRPMHYLTDVQPTLDRHCVRCHGPKKREGKLDLSGELTLFFNRSYEELIDKGFVRGFNEWSRDLPDTYAQPAYSHGSHLSKLIQVLRGEHYEVKLSEAEFVGLVTWVDLNLPYYGSYYGKRNIKYKGQPDFRPIPTLKSACGMGSEESP